MAWAKLLMIVALVLLAMMAAVGVPESPRFEYGWLGVGLWLLADLLQTYRKKGRDGA
jgi:hypothetical protein